MTLAIRTGKVSSAIIIEDNAIQRCHMAAVCRQAGIAVTYEAANGADGLELLERLKSRPQLLVVDLEMPGMDGIEFLQRLPESHQEIFIVVVSCHEQPLLDTVQSMADSLGLRVLAALQKPLTACALYRALSTPTAAKVSAAHDNANSSSNFGPQSLARAIERGDISVHYQPKIDVRSGEVRGVEALARWSVQGIGFIPPENFIAMAEKENLIGGLTQSVMRQAFAQIAQWNRDGLRLSLAVNLSPVLLGQSEIVDEIVGLALQHNLRSEQITFELTEGSLLTGLGAALGSLTRLRIKGFGLSIDDYGKGFSTMHQVAHLPFTELKVDRYFVRGAHERRNLRVILQSALSMARQLNLVSVAEGIETIDDWRLLQDLGCIIGQGWFFSKALPPDQVVDWARSHERRREQLCADARGPAELVA